MTWATVTYQYSLGYDKGTFRDGSEDRFLYKYASGQWYHSGDTLAWNVLGTGGLSSAFLGNGAWHDLGTIGGADWQYKYVSNNGSWQQLLGSVWTDRFQYDYASGQWQDNRLDGWHYLGGTDVASAFLGDGIAHPTGDGFTYQFLSVDNVGRWLFDASHYFRYGYANLSGWAYSLDGGTTWYCVGPDRARRGYMDRR